MAAAGSPHPYGVRASGNALLAPVSDTWQVKSGWLGHLFSDECLLDMLSHLDAASLVQLGATCRVLHVFHAHEPLWRDLLMGEWDQRSVGFVFNGSWRAAYLRRGPLRPLKLYGPSVASDALHRPWHCATAKVDPRWISRDNVQRRRASELSVGEFVRCFEEPNLPVLIEGVGEKWPALHRWSLRNPAVLIAQCGDTPLRVGPKDMRLATFVDYASQQHDEAPLYVFDCRFGDKVPSLAADYEAPPYFSGPDRDLFELLGSRRPDWRWLIIGPALSGSKWHIDPNATSAWNVLIEGAKKWMLFPPHMTPPGVVPSRDMGSVAQPVSLVEWFLTCHTEAKTGDSYPIEFVAKPGECVFVPRGWWHCVLNLEPSIAVTQNYVPPSGLARTLRFLRDRPEQVSGLPTPEQRAELHGRFRDALAAHKVGRDALRAADGEEKNAAAMTEWERIKRSPSTGEKQCAGDAFCFSFFN